MTEPVLNPGNVPVQLRGLIPLARQWGIPDDVYRINAVEFATAEQLAMLAGCFGSAEESEILSDWLTGPESHSSTPSYEYITFTCLTMAMDHARVRLNKLGMANKTMEPTR